MKKVEKKGERGRKREEEGGRGRRERKGEEEKGRGGRGRKGSREEEEGGEGGRRKDRWVSEHNFYWNRNSAAIQ